jgi:hypothetical protein
LRPNPASPLAAQPKHRKVSCPARTPNAAERQNDNRPSCRQDHLTPEPCAPTTSTIPARTSFGTSREDTITEVPRLCDEFFRCHASPAVHAELRTFLVEHGYHTRTGLGAFLDTLSFSTDPH